MATGGPNDIIPKAASGPGDWREQGPGGRTPTTRGGMETRGGKRREFLVMIKLVTAVKLQSQNLARNFWLKNMEKDTKFTLFLHISSIRGY